MKKVAALLVLVLASVALVACGSSSSSSSSSTPSTSESGAAAGGGEKAGGGGSQTLKVEADPNGQLAYTQTTLSAKAGSATIDFNNPQSLSHDITVEDSSGKTIGKSELVAEGSATVDLSNLKPGTYHYFCTVPGHREAGMEGTLTVK